MAETNAANASNASKPNGKTYISLTEEQFDKLLAAAKGQPNVACSQQTSNMCGQFAEAAMPMMMLKWMIGIVH